MKKKNILFLFFFTFFLCSAQEFNKQPLDSLFQVLKQRDKFMGSIAVSQNGQIIYSNAIGFADIETGQQVNVQTKYRIGSISKMYTAVLILKAIEEKKISLNETISHYFPQIEYGEKITISSLLNHRSGIHNFTDDENYLEYHTQPKSRQEMLSIIANGKSDFTPDSKGSYSNANYVLLSYILEKIYKKDYPVILNEKIIQPLGLTNTYFGGTIHLQHNESYSYDFKGTWQKEPETDVSIPMGAGALVSNPTDLTKFIEGLFTGKIISEKSLQVMKTFKDGYGSGMFELPYLGKKSYGHDGAIDRFQSIVTYFPEDKLAIAITSNGSLYKKEAVLLCAENSYFKQPFELPTFENKALTTDVLNSYVGQYSHSELSFKITITRDDEHLFAQATGQATLPLEAYSSNLFKFEEAGITLEFDLEAKGMILKQSGKEFYFTKE